MSGTETLANPARRFHLVTFGCQMNEYDTGVMRSVLRGRGMVEVDSEHDADVVLVNTCAVREGAEERAFGRLQSLTSIKRQRDLVIGMTGCVAQEHGAKILERLPFLDLVIGTRDILKVGNLVEEVWRTGDRFVCVEDIDSPLPLPVRRVGSEGERPLKTMVTVMLGCDKQCTFCIVPKTRGAEWSRPLEEVLGECRHLIAHGYKELMLLGQNVNSYRGAREGGATADFPALLRAVDALGAEMEARGEGELLRIRYTTSHPVDATDDLWAAMRDAPRVCKQLHLPVQSGSDRVLRRMKRLYRRADYLARIASARRHMPDLVMTTDIIVGFCGETDADFEETLSLVREVRFDQAYMFMYSPRAGTPAAEHLADDVPAEVKKERLQRLIALQEEIAAEKNAARVGRVERVLVEGPAKRQEGWLCGRTDGDVVVNFPPPSGGGNPEDGNSGGGMGILPMMDETDHGQDAHATSSSDDIDKRSGAYLPHWALRGATYAVTFRLADSLPRDVVERWLAEREDIIRTSRAMNRALTPEEEKRLDFLFSDRVERHLDAGIGACWMRRQDVARIVSTSLRHFDGSRYRLLAWCVMPNHVHAVVEPRSGHDLPSILHSWKSFSSKEANKALGRTGTFWQAEYYDHLVREAADLHRCMRYVLENPTRARLGKWKWVGAIAPSGEAPSERHPSGGGNSGGGNSGGGTGILPVMAATDHGQDAHATSSSADALVGTIVDVRITWSSPHTLRGECI